MIFTTQGQEVPSCFLEKECLELRVSPRMHEGSGGREASGSPAILRADSILRCLLRTQCVLGTLASEDDEQGTHMATE